MHYKVSAPHPTNHFLSIELMLEVRDETEMLLRLPAWRPGRYEIGNFAKNVKGFEVKDQSGAPLAFRKISKDTWEVKMNGAKSVSIRYSYYAAKLDAGSCWVDEEQIYINPIHCLLYVENRLHELCQLELLVPSSYKVATSLKEKGRLKFFAEDYHELVDSPLIASSGLHYANYTSEGVPFHIWFQGNLSPNWKKILKDFQAFTDEQLRTMGSFPAPEYHFLIQVAPTKLYHGVEHLRSTVLALGPGHQLMDQPLYTDFVGVASHELFHAWNVKAIRPADMLPYDYTCENYSRLGFVYEGVTTYYGDYFLARCGVYSVDQFFIEIGNRLQKHFDNYGRFNLSVADSSFDTWLDGYVPGIPNRKTSIYDEGCLTAMMTDLLIRSKSQNKKSLDDVMKALYTDFAQANIGYTEHDYMEIVNQMAGGSLIDFFMDYIYGTEDDEKFMNLCLNFVGCELQRSSNPKINERDFGFRIKQDGEKAIVTVIAPDSPADKAGLGIEDEIIAVNEMALKDNLDELLSQFTGNKVVVTIINPMKKLRDVVLSRNNKEYYPIYKLAKQNNPTPDAQRSFKAWLKQDFYS